MDIEFYEVLEEGNMNPKDSFNRETDKVYIVIDNKKRNIFLWKGSAAGVRLKFIGSRAMGEKRQELGFHYQIHVLDQDDENNAFLSLFDDSIEDSSPTHQPKIFTVEAESPPNLEELAKAQGVSIEEATREFEANQEHLEGKVASMGGISNRPKRTLLTELDSPDTIPAPKKEIHKKKEPPKPRSSQRDLVKEAQDIIKELGDLKGYSREMVVIGELVYRVGQDGTSLEDLDTPLEGIFKVDEYVPRLICESGKVKLIELLKQTGSSDDLDEKLTQNLSDLTSMFMIEIE